MKKILCCLLVITLLCNAITGCAKSSNISIIDVKSSFNTLIPDFIPSFTHQETNNGYIFTCNIQSIINDVIISAKARKNLSVYEMTFTNNGFNPSCLKYEYELINMLANSGDGTDKNWDHVRAKTCILEFSALYELFSGEYPDVDKMVEFFSGEKQLKINQWRLSVSFPDTNSAVIYAKYK